MRTLAALAVAVACALPAPPAIAQDKAAVSNVETARKLALEAVSLLQSGDYAAALDRVERAEAAFHASTHLLLMGQAQEGLGLLTVAIATYERLTAEPLPAAAPEAFKKAQQAGQARLRDLLARVPSLLVVVRGAPAAETTAKLDGKPLTLGSVAVRRDPGEHAIEVSAPGYDRFEKTIELPARGGVVVVEVDLQPTKAARPAPAAGPPAKREGSPNHVPAFVALGLGGAGIVVGAVTGAMFLGELGDLKDRCPDDQCAPADQADIDSTGTLGNVSTIGFAAGGAFVAAGVVLLLVAPFRRSPDGAATTMTGFRTDVRPGGASLELVF